MRRLDCGRRDISAERETSHRASCERGPRQDRGTALLDRGWDKPKQSDEPEITHRYVVELPPVLTKVEWQEKYGGIVEPTAALEPTQ
jgi:hypothetical protein